MFTSASLSSGKFLWGCTGLQREGKVETTLAARSWQFRVCGVIEWDIFSFRQIADYALRVVNLPERFLSKSAFVFVVNFARFLQCCDA